MKIEEMLITPEVAQKLLKKNTNNRPLNERHVLELCKQMQRGQWTQNGETIKFSKTGRLLDGQHRLASIIKSGKSFTIPVVNGLDDKSFNTIDTGRLRTASDIISVNGYSNSSRVAATIKFLIAFEKGKFSSSNPKREGITNIDTIEYMNNNKGLIEFVDNASSIYIKTRHLSPSLLAGLHYIFSKVNVEQADHFFEKYHTGVGLEKEDPILVLRDKLMQNSINKSKLKIRDKVILVITCWNAFRKGTKVKSIKLGTDLFPKIL